MAREAVGLVSEMEKAERQSSGMRSLRLVPPITSVREFTQARGCGSMFRFYAHGHPQPKLICSNLVLQLLDENPVACEAFEWLADIVMAEQVHIHYTPDSTPGASAVVQRESLLDACSSLDSLHAFLKEQLGIAASQDIDVSWSEIAQRGGKQVQLAGEPMNPFQLAYIAGRAYGWFVTVKQ